MVKAVTVFTASSGPARSAAARARTAGDRCRAGCARCRGRGRPGCRAACPPAGAKRDGGLDRPLRTWGLDASVGVLHPQQDIGCERLEPFDAEGPGRRDLSRTPRAQSTARPFPPARCARRPPAGTPSERTGVICIGRAGDRRLLPQNLVAACPHLAELEEGGCSSCARAANGASTGQEGASSTIIRMARVHGFAPSGPRACRRPSATAGHLDRHPYLARRPS